MLNNYFDTEFIDKAIIYATNAHKNTERREKKLPYIIHPLEVLSICATLTNDKEILAASVLHDTLEDTIVTYEDLKDEFGLRVATIVYNESDNTLEGYSKENTWKINKELAINRLKNLSIECKMVALSDKLSNMRAINKDYLEIGDDVWNRFHENDKHLHRWRFYSLLDCFKELENTYAYKEFKSLIQDTFKDII